MIKASGAAFNSPQLGENFSPEAFALEYWSVHKAVAKQLRTLGEEDDCGDRDFAMNQDYGFSRFIGVELSSKRLWSEQLITTLQDVLLQAPQEYIVYVDHSLLGEPLFFLLIKTEEVCGYSEDVGLFRNFGFTP